MQRRTWASFISAALAAAGCAAIAGIEETTTIPPDAGVERDAGTSIEETPDTAAPPEVDASLCADAAARIEPSRAFVVKTATGTTCGDATRILDADGLTIILDDDPTPAVAAEAWSGRAVHGCVAAQFDGGISAVVVRANMTASDGCGTPCSGSGCNSYHYYGAWLREGDGGVRFVQQQPILWDPTDTVVLLADGGVVDSPQVVICRTSLNTTRDDVAVDYVGGCR